MGLYSYDSQSGNLTTVATSGQRTWVGTKAQYDAAKTAGTLPLNCLICITDDETEMDTVPTEGSPVAVTSDGLYKMFNNVKYNLVAKVIADGNTTQGNILTALYNAMPAFGTNKLYLFKFKSATTTLSAIINEASSGDGYFVLIAENTGFSLFEISSTGESQRFNITTATTTDTSTWKPSAGYEYSIYTLTID